MARLNAFEPFTVTIQVAETRNASAFLKYVADVFEGARPALAQIAKDELVPEQRSNRRTAEATARDTALTDALAAKVATNTAIAKLSDFQSNPSPSAESIAAQEGVVLKSKLAQNVAYRKAGLNEPWSELRF